MAKINSSLKSLIFKYDFAVDGGAMASINMGVFLSAQSIVTSFKIIPITDLTSGGAAIVDIGIVGTPNYLIDNAAVGNNADFTDYNAGTFGFDYMAIGKFVQSQYQYFMPPAEGQVIVSISNFAITAGAFLGIIQYQELY